MYSKNEKAIKHQVQTLPRWNFINGWRKKSEREYGLRFELQISHSYDKYLVLA